MGLMKTENPEPDVQITVGEALKMLLTSIALFFIIVAASWEAMGENFGVALSDLFIGMYLVSVIYEDRFKGVSAPLVGAGLFLFRDLMVRLAENPMDVDWNLIGAGYCFLEAARMIYLSRNDDQNIES